MELSTNHQQITKENLPQISLLNSSQRSKAANGANLSSQTKRLLSFWQMRAPRYLKKIKCFWIWRHQLKYLVMFMANSLIYSGFLTLLAILKTIKNFCLQVIMWTEASRVSKQYVFYQLIKLNSPIIFIYSEEITSASPSTECTVFTTSVKEGTM